VVAVTLQSLLDYGWIPIAILSGVVALIALTILVVLRRWK
jgi:hypothetical protein